MTSEARQPRAVIRNGDVYLRQADGSYALQNRADHAPIAPAPSDAEIDSRVRQDPDAAPEPSDDDLKRARVIRLYSTSEKG